MTSDHPNDQHDRQRILMPADLAPGTDGGLTAPTGTPRGDLTVALAATDPHEALAAVARLRDRLDEAEAQAVFALRLAGCTWEAIAEATGVGSAEVAQVRFGDGAGLLDRVDEAFGRPPRP